MSKRAGIVGQGYFSGFQRNEDIRIGCVCFYVECRTQYFHIDDFQVDNERAVFVGRYFEEGFTFQFDFTLVEAELSRVFDTCLGIEHGFGTVLEDQLHAFAFGNIYLFVAGIGKQVDTFIYIPELTEE